MYFGLYSKPSPPEDWQSIMGYLGRGLEVRGHKITWRNPGPFTPDQKEKFDAVVALGFRTPKRNVIESYASAGIPGLVVEMG